MKSLQTDDIQGASPRVRHMPKNLYRNPSVYSQRHSGQYFPIEDYIYSQNIRGKWDRSHNQNINSSLLQSQQYRNPFIEMPVSNKSIYNPELNQQINRSQEYKDSQYQGIYDRLKSTKIDQTRILYDNQPLEQYIKPKQAMFINYDQLKHYQNIKREQNMYHQRKSSRDLAEKHSSPKNYLQPYQGPIENHLKMDSNINSQANSQIQKNDNIRSSIQNVSKSSLNKKQSSQSLRNFQSRDKTEKNIFRGLGFNIITNSKYLYNVESSLPYTKKQK